MRVSGEVLYTRLVRCVCGAIAFCLLSCGPARFPDVDVRPASEYALSEEAEGLIISVDPLLERRRVMSTFGVDLLRRGVLPVLVVAENKSAAIGFYLQKEYCSLGVPTDSASWEDLRVGDSKVNFAAVGAVQMLSPVMGLLALGIGGDAAIRDHKARQNLVDKELREKTLFPGESQCGFLYFRYDGPVDSESVASVNLGILNLNTYERFSISVPIKDDSP